MLVSFEVHSKETTCIEGLDLFGFVLNPEPC